MFDLKVTKHAAQRMEERGLTGNSLEAAPSFGREIHTRGVTLFVIGRKDVIRRLDQQSTSLVLRGLHVLCSRDGRVVTTYRSFDLRGTRTRSDRYSRAKIGA
jgi:hypothetical protein